jgi:hypothetical protein
MGAAAASAAIPAIARGFATCRHGGRARTMSRVPTTAAAYIGKNTPTYMHVYSCATMQIAAASAHRNLNDSVNRSSASRASGIQCVDTSSRWL